MSNNPQKHVFYVHGMHCRSCELITESELIEVAEVVTVKANTKDQSVELLADFADFSCEQISEKLSARLKPFGYFVSSEKPQKKIQWSEFKVALPIAFVFAGLFVLLQQAGLINLINANQITYSTSFIIGLVASLSSCMAVVGGLLLSLSATFAKEGQRLKPQILFHLGRIISFFVLGGIIGALGAVFTLSPIVAFVLNLLIGLIMLGLGLNLLDIFSWTKKIQPTMPKFIAKPAHLITQFNHRFTPFLAGVVTFFLPCGFTQSMQLYTLTTGDFLTGGLTMLVFSLGTLPVLGLISFSSFKFKDSAWSGVFFKTAGLIVIMFAVLNLLSSLVAIGIIAPIFNF